MKKMKVSIKFVGGKMGRGEKMLLLFLPLATKQWNLPKATKQWNLPLATKLKSSFTSFLLIFFKGQIWII
jgi:hypothetical protein